MKKNLYIFLVTAALMAMLGLVGCSSAQETTEPEAAPTTTESTDAASGTDQATTQDTSSATEAEKPAATDTSTSAQSDTNNYVGEDAAKATALADAGVAEADCVKLEVSLDGDDNPVHYDVDFKAGGYEYDYDIDAVTGEILTSNSEPDDDDDD